MTTNKKPKKIFVEAMSLVQDHMSGVGHNALEIVRAMDEINAEGEYEIILVTTLGKGAKLARHHFSEAIKTKVIPLPARLLEVLLRARILPPVDLYLGPGIYLFPNYKEWPLARSESYLYVHDTVFATHPQYVQPKNLHYLQTYLPGWIKKATHILTISEFSKHEIERLFSVKPQKITVIPCGVDTGKFTHKDSDDINKAKAKYGLKTDNYLLYLGNLEPRKNLERIVAAFGGLPADLKQQYALLLIGADGWLNEGIHQTIEKVRKNGGNIIMPQRYVEDDDLPALISGATALVSPVHYEGFGLSPLQAMACKTPVIVARNSSIPEVVGDAGLYANPEDETDITMKMVEILTDASLRAALAQKGLARSKLFSWQASAQKLISLF
jgi:glycosyltransferase involved in cell wall biosynthesis